MKRLLPGQFAMGDATAKALESLVETACKGMENLDQAYRDALKDIAEREERERKQRYE